MRRDAPTILRDAIVAADDILAMLDGVAEAQFVEDRRTQRATERAVRRPVPHP